MPTETSKLPVRFSRLGVFTALGGFALFLLLVVFVRQGGAPAAQVDVSQIPEGDRWKFSVEGRSSRLAEMQANELKLSTTYGWVDQARGVVRLPIETAMDLALKDINAGPKP
jgi:hypothetical protein